MPQPKSKARPHPNAGKGKAKGTGKCKYKRKGNHTDKRKGAAAHTGPLDKFPKGTDNGKVKGTGKSKDKRNGKPTDKRKGTATHTPPLAKSHDPWCESWRMFEPWSHEQLVRMGRDIAYQRMHNFMS